MSKITDREYLLTEQYEDINNYSARVEFHTRFSSNKYGWYRWVFDRFELEPGKKILELGCGLGNLWVNNINRIPRNWKITVSDISLRMVQETLRALQSSTQKLDFAVMDVMKIPIRKQSFDMVIANHMLYHVSPLTMALTEISRVMKKGSFFFATTVGQTHLNEVSEFLYRFDPALSFFWPKSLSNIFTLENGSTILAEHFDDVKVEKYEDKLIVTESEPFANFVVASLRQKFSEKRKREFTKFIEKELQEKKELYITRDIGIFEAIRS